MTARAFIAANRKVGIAMVKQPRSAATSDQSENGVSKYIYSPLVLPVGLEPTTERL